MAYRDRFIKVDGRSIDSVKRGDLIRSLASPNFVNVVHKVSVGSDDITIYSTRFADYYGGKFRLLHGIRARPFTLPEPYRHRAEWEIVEHIQSEVIDHTGDINVALNKGFDLYIDPDLESDDEE